MIMSSKEKQLWRMMDAGLPPIEIAGELGITHAAAAKRVQRLRKKMKQSQTV